MDGFAFAVNYGLNKVRFPAPVPVDSKVRMRAKLAELEEIAGGAQMIMELTFEREGGDKPVCVAQSVVRVYEVRALRQLRLGTPRAAAPPLRSTLWVQHRNVTWLLVVPRVTFAAPPLPTQSR